MNSSTEGWDCGSCATPWLEECSAAADGRTPLHAVDEEAVNRHSHCGLSMGDSKERRVIPGISRGDLPFIPGSALSSSKQCRRQLRGCNVDIELPWRKSSRPIWSRAVFIVLENPLHTVSLVSYPHPRAPAAKHGESKVPTYLTTCGAITLHGPHHVAKQSRTKMPFSSSALSKSALEVRL